MSTKDLEVTGATKGSELVAAREYDDLIDDTPVDARNIMIPKLLLTQAMSERMQDGSNAVGDIVGSLEGNTLADRNADFEFIPFRFFETWVVKRVVNGKEEYDGTIPVTADNRNLPRESVENIDGVDVIFRNYATINYYCLLNSEIEDGTYMPYVLQLMSFNHGVGKKLESHRARLQAFGTPLAAKTFRLGSEDKKNDKGTFRVFRLSPQIRDTTSEELEAVRKWNNIVKTKATAIVVDDSDQKAAPAPSAAPAEASDIPF